MSDTIERIVYTPAEVAEILDVTTQTVYRMIRRDEIPAIRVGSRRYRIRAKDIEQLLDPTGE